MQMKYHTAHNTTLPNTYSTYHMNWLLVERHNQLAEFAAAAAHTIVDAGGTCIIENSRTVSAFSLLGTLPTARVDVDPDAYSP